MKRIRGAALAGVFVLAAACGGDDPGPTSLAGPEPEPEPEPEPALDLVFEMRVDGNLDIYGSRLDGTELTRLTTHPSDDGHPTVADGRVVFVSSRNGNPDLFSVSLSGGTPLALTSTPDTESEPVLSPDGQKLAYVRSGESASTEVWTASADGSSPAAAFDPFGFGGTLHFTPSWSPDATTIAFTATANGRPDVFLGTIADGSVEPLVATDERDFEPAWSPDGSRIAFVVVTDSDATLTLFEPATEETRQLDTGADPAGQPAWLSDGRLVYTTWTASGPRLRWLDPDDSSAGGEIALPADAEPGHAAGVR